MPEFHLFGSRGAASGQPRKDSDYDLLVVLEDHSSSLHVAVEEFAEPITEVVPRIEASARLADALRAEFGDEGLRKQARAALALAQSVSDQDLDLWLYLPPVANTYSLRLNWHNCDIVMVPGIMGLGFDATVVRGGDYYSEIASLTGYR